MVFTLGVNVMTNQQTVIAKTASLLTWQEYGKVSELPGDLQGIVDTKASEIKALNVSTAICVVDILEQFAVNKVGLSYAALSRIVECSRSYVTEIGNTFSNWVNWTRYIDSDDAKTLKTFAAMTIDDERHVGGHLLPFKVSDVLDDDGNEVGIALRSSGFAEFWPEDHFEKPFRLLGGEEDQFATIVQLMQEAPEMRGCIHRTNAVGVVASGWYFDAGRYWLNRLTDAERKAEAHIASDALSKLFELYRHCIRGVGAKPFMTAVKALNPEVATRAPRAGGNATTGVTGDDKDAENGNADDNADEAGSQNPEVSNIVQAPAANATQIVARLTEVKDAIQNQKISLTADELFGIANAATQLTKVANATRKHLEEVKAEEQKKVDAQADAEKADAQADTN